MSCDCGWDWGPSTPTSGIWRDVRLEAWSGGRIGDVRPVVKKATADEAVVEIQVDVQGSGIFKARLTSVDGQTFASTDGTITVPNPMLWWPINHGEQPLYELVVELRDGDDVLDLTSCRIGLRTVELVTDADDADASWPVDGLLSGSGMELRVNGKTIYCKGANWIPDDVYPSRIDASRYRTRLQQAADANMNMIRVWGGGLYESDDFYEICDEMGLMVWQDFLFACATYTEDDELASEVEAEARDNVSRLVRHPSLVLFNGNNENLWGYRDWSYDGQPWPEAIGERTWGLGYYFDTLPKVVRELAPATPYWPGSPSNGGTRDEFERNDVHPNANEHGNRHIWNVWHGPGHYLGYVGHFPRFCSEFGFHGQPTWPAIEQSIPEDQRRWYSPTMRSHNKNGYDKKVGDGQDKSTTRVSDDFVVPDDFDKWLYLTQIVQARAMTVSLGWFRSLFPYNHGALIWQLNDCWPGSSWSLIDLDTRGVGRLKPAWFAVRRAFAPRVCNLMPKQVTQVGGWGDDAGPLRTYVHNDHNAGWNGTLRLRHLTLDGETLAEETSTFEIGPRQAWHRDVPVAWTSNRRRDSFLVAEATGGERSFWWFAADRDAPRGGPQVEVTVEGNAVAVHAKTLVRDLCLFPERLDDSAAADDACVTLLPGERHTFHITGGRSLDPEAFWKPPVLQHV
jgi:beta-mannosidase